MFMLADDGFRMGMFRPSEPIARLGVLCYKMAARLCTGPMAFGCAFPSLEIRSADLHSTGIY